VSTLEHFTKAAPWGQLLRSQPAGKVRGSKALLLRENL